MDQITEIEKLKQELELLKEQNAKLLFSKSENEVYKSLFFNSSYIQIVFNQDLKVKTANYYPIRKNKEIIFKLLGPKGYLILQSLFEYGSKPENCEVMPCNGCPISELIAETFRSKKDFHQRKTIIKFNDETGTEQHLLVSGRYIIIEDESFVFLTLNDITEKALIEKQLSLSENRFRTYFEKDKSIKLLISVPDGQVVNANEAATAFYGYTKQKLCSLNISKINTMSFSEIQKQMNIATQNPANYFVFKHKISDGSLRDVEVFAAPMEFENKKVMHITIHDVTEATKYRNKLKEANHRFKNLLDNLDAYIYVVDLETQKIRYANKRINDIFGNVIGELCWNSFELDKNICDVCGRKRIEKKATNSNKVISGVNFFPKIKKWMTYHDRVILWTDGKPARISISLDVTDRIEAQQKLKESEQMLSTAQKVAHIGSWFYSFEKGTVTLSEESYELLEIDKNKKEIKLSDFRKYLHTEDLTKIRQAWNKALVTGRLESEFRLILNKKQRWIYEVANINFNDKNKPESLIGVSYDISEKKEKELKMQELNEHLEQALNARDRIFSIIAHDLRSPFNSILGFAQLLQSLENEIAHPKFIKYNRLLYISIERALELLDNLLDWAKQQRGEISFAPTFLNLTNTVENVIDLYENAAIEKGLKIQSFVAENQKIYADEKMLRAILRNLVSNALKFTQNGGQIEISYTKDQKYSIIEVKDNGIGMSAKEIKNIFDDTKTYTKSGTNKEKGSGLGLKLCRDMAKIHTGFIRIESEKEKHSTFSLYLPHKTDMS